MLVAAIRHSFYFEAEHFLCPVCVTLFKFQCKIEVTMSIIRRSSVQYHILVCMISPGNSHQPSAAAQRPVSKHFIGVTEVLFIFQFSVSEATQ